MCVIKLIQIWACMHFKSTKGCWKHNRRHFTIQECSFHQHIWYITAQNVRVSYKLLDAGCNMHQFLHKVSSNCVKYTFMKTNINLIANPITIDTLLCRRWYTQPNPLLVHIMNVQSNPKRLFQCFSNLVFLRCLQSTANNLSCSVLKGDQQGLS